MVLNDIANNVMEHGFDSTLIDGPTVIIGNGFAHSAHMYFCYKLPRLAFSKVEKIYWQNDVDGVNRLISEYMGAGDIKPNLIHFAENAKYLSERGLHIPFDGYEMFDLLNIGEHDVFFALDEDGDLVRAEVA